MTCTPCDDILTQLLYAMVPNAALRSVSTRSTLCSGAIDCCRRDNAENVYNCKRATKPYLCSRGVLLS
jgi:hypothetical protein